MSIAPDHNGTLPDSHVALREAGRQQRQADARLVATPIPPIDQSLSAFRHWPLVAAVGLLALLIIVLFWPASVGAAERRTSVVIERVTGDAGFYVVKLDSGQVLVITPPRRAPALTPGAALMDSGALWQGDWRYPISRRAVKR